MRKADKIEKDKLRRDIGQRVRALRKHLKLYQGAMADLLGISRSSFARMERGDILPNPFILNTLRTRFNVSLDWLITGEGDMIREEKEDKDKYDFGKDEGLVDSLLEVMQKVPFTRYAILNYFFDFYDEHQEVIDKTLSEYDRLQGKIKNRPPLKAQGWKKGGLEKRGTGKKGDRPEKRRREEKVDRFNK